MGSHAVAEQEFFTVNQGMVTMSTKEQMVKLIQGLPEDTTVEDAMEQL